MVLKKPFGGVELDLVKGLVRRVGLAVVG